MQRSLGVRISAEFKTSGLYICVTPVAQKPLTGTAGQYNYYLISYLQKKANLLEKLREGEKKYYKLNGSIRAKIFQCIHW